MNSIKQRMLNQSMKTKWTFATGITIFFSFAVITIILYVALQTWLINNEEKNALRTVDDVTTFFEMQGATVTIQQIQHNKGLMKAILTQEQTVRIFNLDGIEILRINDVSVAANIPSTVDELLSPQITEQEIDGTHAFVVNKIVHIGPFQGIMQLVHPLTTFDAMMKYMMTTMLIVGLGALLFSVSISYYLAKLLMKPLVGLRDSMEAVRKKGFEEQLNLHYTADDEIGDLLRIYRSMINELEMAFMQQQQFVSDASHELRTPIQVVEGHLSLIKRWGKDDPDILDEALNTSLAEISRMKTMIEELLNLARREKMDPHASANVEQVLQSVTEELAVLYPRARFSQSVVGQQTDVAMSEQALAQVFRNLIENGIRYNDEIPHIQTTIHYDEDNVFVQIEDNGIGISQQNLPHIFDRFYRVDESRGEIAGGTGLGLSITKMLVEKYRVGIEVKSQVGVGTLFLLQFSRKNNNF